jgi:hypothetical protein
VVEEIPARWPAGVEYTVAFFLDVLSKNNALTRALVPSMVNISAAPPVPNDQLSVPKAPSIPVQNNLSSNYSLRSRLNSAQPAIRNQIDHVKIVPNKTEVSASNQPKLPSSINALHPSQCHFIKSQVCLQFDELLTL